jgi:DNA-binding XRE family transcriptional regulator
VRAARNDPFAKPLYGLTPVPRVRIPPSPPRSLNRRESRLFYLRNTREMPVFRDNSSTNCTRENGLLGSEAGHCLGFSLKARCAVRFQGGHWANAMRSQAGGRTRSVLSSYERGKRNPDLATAMSLSALYDVPLNKLFPQQVGALNTCLKKRQRMLAVWRRTQFQHSSLHHS